MLETNLLIIGAGPYGLAATAYARERGVDTLLAGRPMSFWHDHMPAGMLVRSPLDWQIDPFGRRTILAFLEERGISLAEADPLPVELFRHYGAWFRESYNLQPQPLWINEISKTGDRFEALCQGGERLFARAVLLAPGFAAFAHIPPELAQILPSGHYSYTCDTVEFGFLRGRRCLIVGGRQSAYEWAVLMAEAGAAQVQSATATSSRALSRRTGRGSGP